MTNTRSRGPSPTTWYAIATPPLARIGRPERPWRESVPLHSPRGHDRDRAQAPRSAASGSRPATGSRCARPTTARSSDASRRAARTRREARVDAAERAMARAASGARAGRDPRPRAARLVEERQRRGRADDLGRGRQADEGGTRRGGARGVDVHDGRRRGAEARRRRRPDGRVAGRRRASSRSRCASRSAIVGAISPFNFPLNLVAHKVAPALAAGCAGRARSPRRRRRSPRCCSPSSRWRRGCPPGWLNVVCGPAAEIGDVLVEDERVALITFTGSVGRRLEAPRARAAQAREPRARQRDAGDRRRRRRPRRRRDARSRRTRSRSPARAASRCSGSTSSAPRTTRSSSASSRASRRSWSAIRPTRRPTSARSSRRRARPRPRVDRGGDAPRRATSSPAASSTGELLRPTVIADAPPRREGRRARRSSARSARSRPTTPSTRRSRSRTARATGSRRAIFTSDVKAALRAAHELEFGGVTVNEAPDVPRRPDAVRRRQGLRQHARRARPTPSAR